MAEQMKVAIVVGASGGIGSAIALRLARDGFAIVAHYAGNPARVVSSSCFQPSPFGGVALT